MTELENHIPAAEAHTESDVAVGAGHPGSSRRSSGGVRFAGLRLAGLIGALVLLGVSSPWTLVVVLALVLMIFLQ